MGAKELDAHACVSQGLANVVAPGIWPGEAKHLAFDSEALQCDAYVAGDPTAAWRNGINGHRLIIADSAPELDVEAGKIHNARAADDGSTHKKIGIALTEKAKAGECL